MLKGIGKVTVGLIAVFLLGEMLMHFSNPRAMTYLLGYLMKYGTFAIGIGVGVWLARR